MISIFFFAVIAAVCTQIFSSARIMSRQSRELTGAVNATSNVAEYFRSWDGTTESWDAVFPEGIWAESNVWYQAYDDDWNPVEQSGTYVVILRMNSADGLVTADITAQPYEEDTTEEIYTLEVAKR
jgi:allantoicase